jgi:hypothetical protein
VAAPEVRPGWAFRYWDEVYLTPDEVSRVRERGSTSGPLGLKSDDF